MRSSYSRLAALAMVLLIALMLFPSTVNAQAADSTGTTTTVSVRVDNNNFCTTQVRVVQDSRYLRTIRLDGHERLSRTVVVKRGLPITFEVMQSICTNAGRYTLGPFYPQRASVMLSLAESVTQSYLRL